MIASILTIGRKVDLYSAFVRNAFLEMLAYRLRYYTGIFTYLLFVSVHYFIWKAVYAAQPAGAEVKGFTLSEMVSYVAIGWIARSLYFSNIDEVVDELVRSGQISIYLLRPVNFQLMLLSKAIGESLFRLSFFSLPIGAVILFTFPVSPPASVAHFFLFLLATLGGFFVLALLNFLVGLLAFDFKSIRGVMRAKYFLVQLLSGLLLPLTFFPKWVQPILDFLPFKIIAYVPLQFYLGKISVSESPAVFLSILAWILAFVILGVIFGRRSFDKLTIQGG